MENIYIVMQKFGFEGVSLTDLPLRAFKSKVAAELYVKKIKQSRDFKEQTEVYDVYELNVVETELDFT